MRWCSLFSCIVLSTFGSCWWVWRFGAHRIRLWSAWVLMILSAALLSGERQVYWHESNMTTLSSWREYDTLHIIITQPSLITMLHHSSSPIWISVCHQSAQGRIMSILFCACRGIDFLGDTVGLANRFAMCGANSAGVNQVVNMKIFRHYDTWFYHRHAHFDDCRIIMRIHWVWRPQSLTRWVTTWA